jgi:hypothetical protein
MQNCCREPPEWAVTCPRDEPAQVQDAAIHNEPSTNRSLSGKSHVLAQADRGRALLLGGSISVRKPRTR